MRQLGSIASFGILLVAAACSRPTLIHRTLGGEDRIGPYVTPRRYESFIRGEYLASIGDFGGAIAAYERARDPERPDPVIDAQLALAMDQAGRTELALTLLDEVMRIHRSTEPILLARARILERADRFDEAKAAYRAAIAVAPSSEAPVLALAEILERERDLAGATELANAFLERNPGSRPGRQLRLRLAVLNGTPTAIRDATASLVDCSHSPPESDCAPAAIRTVIEVGYEALGAGRPEVAAAIADGMPDEVAVPAHIFRARAYATVGRANDAELQLQQTSIETADDALVHVDILLTIDRAQLALEAAEIGIEKDGRVPVALLALGRALIANGAVDQGLRALREIPSGTSVDDRVRAALAEK